MRHSKDTYLHQIIFKPIVENGSVVAKSCCNPPTFSPPAKNLKILIRMTASCAQSAMCGGREEGGGGGGGEVAAGSFKIIGRQRDVNRE